MIANTSYRYPVIINRKINKSELKINNSRANKQT